MENGWIDRKNFCLFVSNMNFFLPKKKTKVRCDDELIQRVYVCDTSFIRLDGWLAAAAVWTTTTTTMMTTEDKKKRKRVTTVLITPRLVVECKKLKKNLYDIRTICMVIWAFIKRRVVCFCLQKRQIFFSFFYFFSFFWKQSCIQFVFVFFCGRKKKKEK